MGQPKFTTVKELKDYLDLLPKKWMIIGSISI